VSDKQSSSPVFYDPRGRRWKRVRRTWLALAIFVTIVVTIFIASVLANPFLATPALKPLKNLPSAGRHQTASARHAHHERARAESQEGAS
jgi:predicted PurR-regulated permease PerM